MKKILSFLLVLSVGITVVMAQPQKMTYQAVVRNNNNELIVNQQVGVRVSILEDSVNGPIIYRETHTPTTNFNGLITMMIGEGIHPYTYTLDDVKWGKHTHYMSIEIDPAGGTNYTIFGTQQMVTVPYAFYSESAKYVDTANYAANALHADTAYYLAGFTNSDTALFAYNADTAVYANAANTSNMSNAANYADSARVANASNTALSANYADSTRISGSAISANYATTAGSATTATSATYADSTQVADFAHNANAANTAILTTYSTYADTAYFLMNAQNSDTAKFAYNSDTTNYAYSSGTANSALSAQTANYADSARVANVSNTAFSANYADSARVANTSNTAFSANYADSTRISNTALSTNYATLAGSATVAASATYADSTQVADFAHNANAANTAIYADSSDYNHLSNRPKGANTGDILYWNTTDSSWHVVPAGNIGEILAMDSTKIPYWKPLDTVALPLVETDSSFNITTNAAQIASTVKDDGGSPFVFSGICWSMSPNPTTTDMHTLDGLSKTSITSYMTGLTMGTIYHVRAYAIGSAGTAYGNEITFRTQTYPTVSTDAVSNISVTTAVSGGDVTDDGGAPITARGICWSITPMPTIADSHTSDGIGAGAFASSLTTLARYTKYYVRAYATNYIGTSYGDTVSFTTLADFPTVTTAAVGSITSVTAVVGGNVTDDGDATVTARGICYNTTGNPTIADNTLPIGSGTGSFSATLSGLTASTTYYICAYATNSIGTSYGSTISFTTLAPWTCGISTITDYDNNVYNTIQLGTQCWMRENMRTTHYANGASITLGSSSSTTTKYRYNPNGDANNVATYGYLYNWPAVMNDASSSSANPSGVQGVCPTGWHVPSDAEWTQLTDYVSGQSQYWCGGNSTYIAKSLCSSMYWVSTSTTTCYVGYDLSANNATGFNIVPSGNYENGGSYGSFGSAVQYWTCTLNGDQPYDRRFREYSAVVTRSSYVKNCGRSVRCIKD